MKDRLILLSIVAVAFVGAGCEAPVVSIEHALPAAVPIEGMKLFPVTMVTTSGDADAKLADFTERLMRERLAEVGLHPSPEQSSLGGVSGHMRVTAQDAAGQRQVRHWDPETDEMRVQTVDSLVRHVDVVARFGLTAPDSSRPVVIEISRSYDSRGDPRAWGELGLQRPDDPAAILPAEQISRKLVAQCVDSFIEMVRPLSITAEVPMRYAGPEEALAAAEEGRFADAQAAFEAALVDTTNADLLFNAGLAAEADDDLPAAALHYMHAVDAADNDDAEAAAGYLRVVDVVRRRQRP
jgi:hypothetical protein